jgi:hypothetical protein
MNNATLQPIRPLFLIFVSLSAFFITGKSWLLKQGIQPEVVIVGNMLLFIISLSAFLLTKKSFAKPGGNAFIRAIYGSFMLKFFVLAIAAFIYIMIAKKNVNKPGLILCAALYFIYTVLETRALMKMLKQNKNA